jgi:hypothetical protein
MLANGIGFAVILGVTPILSGKKEIDSYIALSVLASLQVIAVVLILFTKKAST